MRNIGDPWECEVYIRLDRSGPVYRTPGSWWIEKWRGFVIRYQSYGLQIRWSKK